MLEVRDLHFAYGKTGAAVLSGVSFMVENGCSMAVLGRNGAGKSTLIRCIDGILRPQSGSVLMDGKEILTLPRREIARLIAYVPQHAGEEELTVFDAVLLGRRPYIRWDASARDREIVMETLAELGLEALMLRPLGELSGGELQKVIIARALVQEPKLLLFDEPTSSLDPMNQHEVMSLVSRIVKEKDICAVSVLHDLNLAARWCGRFLFLKEGRSFACGGAEVLNAETVEAVFGMRAEKLMHNGVPILIPDFG